VTAATEQAIRYRTWPEPQTDHPAGTPPVRVFVVAHDGRVRASLASLVAADDLLALVGTARTGEQARRTLTVDPTSVDVVLVDIALPTRAAGHALIHDLAEHPGWPFTVVSLSFDLADDRSARSSGAVAHLTKSTAPEEITTVLARVTKSNHTTSAPVIPRRGAMGSRSGSTSPLGRGGLALAVLAMFVPPWLFWLSALGQSAGWWTWRLPQGAALWSMTLPLLAVIAARGGRPALVDLWGRLTRWRVSPWAYAAALGAPVLLGAASAGVAVALGARSPVGQLMSLPGALVYLVYGTGLFLLTEELAWRGVLLPRLQERMTSLVAAVVVGLVWGLWHLPLLLVPGQHDHGLPLLGFLLLIVPTSVMVTALVATARGSVVVAAAFHASFDAAYSWFGVVGTDHRAFWAAVVLSWLAAAGVAELTRGRLVLGSGR
jgi:membrane protease YdiL (CAAX protease family)